MDAAPSAARAFFEMRRLAVVGVSRDRKSFSQALFRELKERGYDVVPVNPLGGHVQDVACVGRLSEVSPPPEGVLVLTPPAITEQVVRECAEAGVRRVWMHRGTGPGSVSASAVAFCREHGIEVIDGACPFMYLPKAAIFHRVHGWFRRRHERRAAAAAHA